MSSQTATILVTDLVGSTELRVRLGDEEAERLRRVQDRILRASVETHGGVVVKGLGDGVLASFPEANAALAAAVAIQQAADAHTRRHPDLPLLLRVGLSAGDVTVDEGDHFGTSVVEAIRLCGAAEGGQILAAEVVRLLVKGRGRHRFSAAGALELKGLPEPVRAVEVGWDHGAPCDPGRPFPELLGTGAGLGFAGRTGELELLSAAWKEAHAGERRGVLIAGEPGVGKTRLAGEFARHVHDAGGTVIYGRCEEDLGIPYEPFVEALAFFCEHTPAHELRSRLGRYPGELARLLPDLADLIPGLERPLRSDPETEQFRLFEAVASWLAAAGEAAGLLFVVDDLHWAPLPTLHLLAHVMRSAGPARLLVVTNFRDTEVSPAFGAVLADLRRTSGIERIHLEGLSVDELAELLAALPSGQAAQSLALTLHEGTEGNPFFVGELLRRMADQGFAVEAGPVPEGVREVIVSRVARLSAWTRELLGVASVLGRNLELDALTAVAGTSGDEAVAAMDEALAARLVEETEAGAYRFVHALVRSALYDTLSATRRARLHLRAAQVYEQELNKDAAREAHHLVASAPLGEPNRTARACLAAGDRALSVLADAEAQSWYSEGLRFAAGEDEPRLRIDLLTGLGEAQRRTGDPDSRQTLLDAARLAAEQGEGDRLVRAVLANNRGISSFLGHVDEERIGLIETALDVVGPLPTSDRAELLALHAAELLFAGDHRRVLQAADEAAAIAATLDDVTVRARVGVRRFQACLVPDRVTDMAAQGHEVVRSADGSGDPHLRTWSRALMGHALLLTGDLARARRLALEAMDIADETGQPGLRCLAHSFCAVVRDALGEHEEAQRLAELLLKLGQEAGWPDATLWYISASWVNWLFEGQLEVAITAAAQTLPEYPRLAGTHGAWLWAMALAGRNDEVEGHLAELPAVPVDLFWLGAQWLFAMAHGSGSHNPKSAAVLYDLLLPYRSLHGALGASIYLGPVEVALAVAAREKGDADAALSHHRAAAAIIERCGVARARAVNDYQWAVTLLARDAPGDRQQATAILETALEYCRSQRYVTYESLIEQLISACRSGPPGTTRP